MHEFERGTGRRPLQVLPLMMELLDAGCAAMGISPAAGAMDRLMAYARSVAHFPTALKEVRELRATVTCCCASHALLSQRMLVCRPVPRGLFELSPEAAECAPLSDVVEWCDQRSSGGDAQISRLSVFCVPGPLMADPGRIRAGWMTLSHRPDTCFATCASLCRKRGCVSVTRSYQIATRSDVRHSS